MGGAASAAGRHCGVRPGPDDIGPMIAGLLTEGHCWVDAQRIEVSGGQGI